MNLQVNGVSYEIQEDPAKLLLWVLRDELGLTGTKYACGVGICGSCTVLVDGAPTRACITPQMAVDGKDIQTIEGLAEQSPEGEMKLHPVQTAFLELQVPQCSWCMSGQMMTAAALLVDNPNPSQAEIVEAMSQNYCRCGCYYRIKQAVGRAAELMADQAGAA